MTLTVITAAIEVAAAAAAAAKSAPTSNLPPPLSDPTSAQQTFLTKTTTHPHPPAQSRHSSSLSDSTSADTDQFESDSSIPNRPPKTLTTTMPVTEQNVPTNETIDPCLQPPKKRRTGVTPTNPHPTTPPIKSRKNLSVSKSQPALLPDHFPAEMLLDLAGSTSAQVRRMNDDERALVHYKRRLRNRESAKRSRARRQATISDIQAELDDLRQLTSSLVDSCLALSRTNGKQSQELETLRKENHLLESLLRSSDSSL